MIDEGVIKFNHKFLVETEDLSKNEYSELESIRQILFQKELIGCYPGNIGYGNLSQVKDYSKFYNTDVPQFLISSTQTGHKDRLDGGDYTRVVDYDFPSNTVYVAGPSKASSESLTHASIYNSSEKIKCVIHIHNNKIWSELLKHGYPKIPKNIAYGTREMANYASQIVDLNSKNKLFVMEGHDDGVIFYDENLVRCLDLVLEIYQKII